MDDRLSFLRDVGRGAFSLLRKVRNPLKVVGVNPLGQKSMRIDVALEDYVIGRLLEENVGGRLVTEEKGEVKLSGRGVMLLDPLDGSNNFQRGVPSYGMAVSLAGGNKYTDITHSYIIDLAIGTEYWAVKGEGAFINGRKAKASGETDLSKCILEYDPNNNPGIYGRILPLLKNVKDVRRFGANALALCYIASGAHHLFLDIDNGLSIIHAPGLKIAEEAGAVVTDANGRAINPTLRPDSTLSFVCSANRPLHKKALGLLKQRSF
jgi:myo-inositol-1(or 4)-monophosphatase